MSGDWGRIKAIAMDAWDRPEAEREPSVRTACAGDESLVREVLSLIASMAAADSRFEPPDADSQIDSLAGHRVGAYEVLSRIGAGGMGEVYMARDTRLDRIVAIKVLPARFGADPWSRERIVREARVVAALNHPHICTIHDIGNQDGRDFFVMEFVDGETLATRLSRGRLPLPEALQYAEHVVSALAEAHRAGIVHRDVKPANIMLSRATTGLCHAKLLDFGVSKSGAANAPFAATGGSIQGSLDLTMAGIVVGTPHYMAPEQLDGQAADVRTDIFAAGAVLFEMLTGRKAFEGADRNEVLSAIRSADVPRPSELQRRVPPSLDRLVIRCLARDPAERYQTTAELLVDLRLVQRRLGSVQRWRVLATAGIVTTIGAAIAWMIGGGVGTEYHAPPTIARIPASAGVLGAPALSPDGSSVVFSSTGDAIDNPELVLLPVGSTRWTRLTNDPGLEELPTWSPAGDSIAFVRCDSRRCGIFTLPIGGGAERKLLDLRADRYFALAWSPDGQSLAYTARSSASEPYGLFLLSLRNLTTRRLSSADAGSALRVAFSPDGRTLAVVRVDTTGIGVHLVAVDNGREKALLTGQQEWLGGVTWSADGRSLILSANRHGVRRLWRLPAVGGNLQELAIAGEDAYFPSLSRQGNRLIFVREFRDWDISRAEMAGGTLRVAGRFPSSPRIDLDPSFSPDGRKIAFVSERGGTRELWVSNAEGTDAQQRTSLNGPQAGRPSWSPDGRSIAFHAGGIYVVPAEGGPARRLAIDGEAPTWSSDGEWIYFMRTVAGAARVLKVAARGGDPVPIVGKESFVARERQRNLYFSTMSDGIWRRSLSGGDEVPVIKDFSGSLPGYWTVFDDGIYFVVRQLLPDNTSRQHLKFFDFARQRTIELGTLPGTIDDWVGGLTVSSDRKTILYSDRTYQSSEIMLVENFR
jgi:eukaryotic-like serine/threonine-protein kinase